MSHVNRSMVMLVVLAAASLAGIPAALAQRDAGSKLRGEYNFYGRSGGSAMRSARDHSRIYRQYVQTAPAQEVNPEIAREAADTIGTYIVKAQRHMAWMRQQAHAAGDKETLTALDSIDKNLTAAAKSHHEMHDTCLKLNVHAEGSMKCCQQIDDSLKAAIAEHDELMKRLAGQQPAAK